ncbi:MAG: hypothetical protein Q9187_009610, partial [Circinaria calcarea]
MAVHAHTHPCSPYFGFSETETETLDTKRYEAALRDPIVFHGTPYPVDPTALAAIYAGPSREEIITHGQKEISNSGPEGGFEIADYTQIKDGISEAERATIDLKYYLDPLSPITPAAGTAINRLGTLFSLRKFRNWGPDVVYKAFDNLDQALFNSKLQHHCKLHWRNEADSVEDGT